MIRADPSQIYVQCYRCLGRGLVPVLDETLGEAMDAGHSIQLCPVCEGGGRMRVGYNISTLKRDGMPLEVARQLDIK